jgi:hypothetical protein
LQENPHTLRHPRGDAQHRLNSGDPVMCGESLSLVLNTRRNLSRHGAQARRRAGVTVKHSEPVQLPGGISYDKLTL